MTAASVLTALFNGAWQGALLCGTAYAAFRFVRTLNATTMFTVWSVLLGICIMLPAANAVFSSRPYVRVTVQSAATVPQRAGDFARGPLRPIAKSAAASPANAGLPPTSLRERLFDAAAILMRRAAIVLLLLGTVAIVRLALLGREVVAMFAARRAARPIAPPVDAQLAITRPFAFAASESLTSPCVLGFSPALIVIPEQILGAPKKELLSIVLHEAEHVRRYDDVQNMLHRVVWAVAFFCPGVRIALRQLALFREQICDDAAVNGVGDPVAYAMTLTGMAQWAQGRGVPVPSFVFKRKQLLQRLDTLLDRAVNHSLRINRGFAASAALVFVLAAGLVLRVQVPVIAQVIVQPKPAAAPVAPRRAPRPAAAAAVRVSVQTQAPAKPAAVAKRAPAAQPVKPHAPAHAAKRAEHARAHEEHLLQLHQRVSIRTGYRTSTVIASSAQMSAASAAYAAAVAAAPRAPGSREEGSNALLSALEAVGMRNLSVDQLIALRDHGVTAALVTEAHAFFRSALTPEYLVLLTDRGVAPAYLQSLRSVGLSGISPEDVVRLRDHGVDASYIQRVRAYNARAGIDDIIRLRDSGF